MAPQKESEATLRMSNEALQMPEGVNVVAIT